jgi:hypothetical protein
MSDDFTPSNSGNANTEYTGEQRNYPTPKDGSRRARVSLIWVRKNVRTFGRKTARSLSQIPKVQ